MKFTRVKSKCVSILILVLTLFFCKQWINWWGNGNDFFVWNLEEMDLVLYASLCGWRLRKEVWDTLLFSFLPLELKWILYKKKERYENEEDEERRGKREEGEIITKKNIYEI